MKELKPCPCCGNKEIEIEQNQRNGYKILCIVCGIKLEQKVLRFSLDWLKEKMIETWNKRNGQL